MIDYKQGMFLFCVASIFQASCSDKVIKGGVALLSIGSLAWMYRAITDQKEEAVVYRNETARLLAYSDIKAALEMLSNSSDCTISYGFYDIDGDYCPPKKEWEKPQSLYKKLRHVHPSFLERAALNVEVCSEGLCIEVPSLKTPRDMKAMLDRIHGLEQ